MCESGVGGVVLVWWMGPGGWVSEEPKGKSWEQEKEGNNKIQDNAE